MVSAGDYFGTSGYVVEDQSTGERFLLIVYHLPKRAGTYEIYQPDTLSSYYYIGNVVNYNEYVDAAIVRANEELGVEFDPRIRLPDGSYVTLTDIVTWSELPTLALLRYQVNIMGVVSGHVSSVIAGYTTSYHYRDQYNETGELRYVIFLASCVTTEGDSGAPSWVPRWGGNELLGHVYGCDLNTNRTIVVSAAFIEEYLLVTPVVG